MKLTLLHDVADVFVVHSGQSDQLNLLSQPRKTMQNSS